MANWTNESQPFGQNRAPLLTGWASDGSNVGVPVAVDPATGRLLVNSTGSSASSVALNDGVTTSRKATVATLTNANPLAVEIVDGAGTQITSFGGGTQYTTGSAQATPTGTVALGWDTTSVRALSTDSTGKLNVLGTVTANAGTNLNTSLLALESGGNLATLAGAITASVSQDNVKQINGVTPLMGNGVTGTGSQRVTIASDNTAFAVNATLSAETTKVIGVTRTADGSGNLLTSTTNALDVNLKTSAASNISTNVAQMNGVAVTMGNGVSGTGVQRVAIASDNTAVSGMGVAATAGAVPANANYIGIKNGSGNLDGLVEPTADGVAATGMVSSGTMGFNGTTWNRVSAQFVNGDGNGDQVALDTNARNLIYNGASWDTMHSVAGAATGTLAVGELPSTSGGLSIITGSVAAVATAIKASAGQLYGYHLFNTTAAVAFVQIFNVAAGSVTLGTTVPNIAIGIPASAQVTMNFDKGIAFSTAISYGCTTTRTGNTGAACAVNFFYA